MASQQCHSATDTHIYPVPLVTSSLPKQCEAGQRTEQNVDTTSEKRVFSALMPGYLM